ncbi:uncharacterized protein EI90DRAFT_3131514 [Cantharellus anzutake]|uniref:uncharacterized protein n=1 Tax=Cantharellus anzutake TaxID=1750568 RepID=UPI001907EF9E|nr:uncharacterized protein EI90DRAFT_3131514 [Cantharellus anzutake]KAF8321861.1 hypothetical protein EI90DRAFT_3131514 [Cantharellus anzutake]
MTPEVKRVEVRKSGRGRVCTDMTAAMQCKHAAPSTVVPTPNKHANRSTGLKTEEISTPTTCHIQWLANPAWMDQLVSYLLENPSVHLKLCGDSSQTVKAESQSRVSTGEKKDYWAIIAKSIWDQDDKPEHAFYIKDLAHYTTAIQGQISWLETQYNYLKFLKETGQGVKTDEEIEEIHANKMVEIHSKFPWFDDLDGIWSTL